MMLFDLQHEENGSQCGTELPHVWGGGLPPRHVWLWMGCLSSRNTTLIWKDEKQNKEILDQVSARHFLEIKWISHFKKVNWHCVLTICKYELSSKNRNFANTHGLHKRYESRVSLSLGSPGCPWMGLPPQWLTTFPVLNTSDKLWGQKQKWLLRCTCLKTKHYSTLK